jgi:hypothetical protein
VNCGDNDRKNAGSMGFPGRAKSFFLGAER